MKDSKFIELLNLYVDHEIAKEDAALLEAEIQANPQRHRVYAQYCQMQKACTVLAQDFRSRAPEVPAGNIVPSSRHRSPAQIVAYASGLLAAACLALVFVSREKSDEMVSITNANPTQQFAMQANRPPAAVTLVRQNANSISRPALQTVFAGLMNEIPAGETTAQVMAGQNQLDWMNGVQLQRVPVDELRFESRPGLQPDARTYRSRQPLQAQVEMTAFQFQR